VGPPRGQGEPGGLPFRLPDLDRIRDTAAGAGMAFAARASGRLLAVDVKAGKEAWSSKIDGHVLAGSAWFDGEAFVVCTENPGAVYRFAPKTGEQLATLTFERADDRLTDVPAWQPAARRLCVVVGDREVRNIDVRRGKTLWSVETDGAVGRITASPDEARVVVLPSRWTFGGKVQCIDAKTGKVTWTAEARTKDPDAVYVGDRLMISVRDDPPGLIAQRLSDGKQAWVQRLRGTTSADRIVGWGEFVIVGGMAMQPDLRGEAMLIRKADGAVVRTWRRKGAGFTTVRAVGETLILCSTRGSEAYRMTTARAVFRDLAGHLAGADEAEDVLDVAGALFAAGRHEAAMARLEEALMREDVEPARFARLHDRLAAVREAATEESRPIYEAPYAARAPEIDGRLAEDWRVDRAAMLDRPRSIERIQSELHPGRFWHGPNDLSAALYVAWDAENLYLAVDVHDDVQTTHDFESEAWQGDCLMVGIDPEHDGGYRQGGNDTVFWLALSAKPRRDDAEEDRLGGQHRIKVKEDETGTVYELSLPWADLGVHGPRAGVRLGLNVLAIDDDRSGKMKAVSWTPGLTQNRRKELMFTGIAPELFGTVILRGR
ncbi:MAG: PQQ-binding-like beta-propeller repeat protein, partial [bacterium]